MKEKINILFAKLSFNFLYIGQLQVGLFFPVKSIHTVKYLYTSIHLTISNNINKVGPIPALLKRYLSFWSVYEFKILNFWNVSFIHYIRF